MKDFFPKLGAGVAQATLGALALWAAGKVGFGPALAGLSVAQALMARAMGSTNGDAVVAGAPGAVAGGGVYFMG